VVADSQSNPSRNTKHDQHVNGNNRSTFARVSPAQQCALSDVQKHPHRARVGGQGRDGGWTPQSSHEHSPRGMRRSPSERAPRKGRCLTPSVSQPPRPARENTDLTAHAHGGAAYTYEWQAHRAREGVRIAGYHARGAGMSAAERSTLGACIIAGGARWTRSDGRGMESGTLSFDIGRTRPT
jgi:hypothetical protein